MANIYWGVTMCKLFTCINLLNHPRILWAHNCHPTLHLRRSINKVISELSTVNLLLTSSAWIRIRRPEPPSCYISKKRKAMWQESIAVDISQLISGRAGTHTQLTYEHCLDLNPNPRPNSHSQSKNVHLDLVPQSESPAGQPPWFLLTLANLPA